jgi:UDP-N-acetylmuramoyl-tripeptide--D-alanyl-D-alanine ligase
MEKDELYKLISEGGISISIDTRTIKSDDVYIGLKGDVFDGNAYAKDALDKGARLAIIDNAEYKADERCIVVENSYDTLKQLATMHRKGFSIPILVIGGSNGKTTTKELVTAVLARKYAVHTTRGNLNNEIGVPLTILAMSKDAEIAVIEIGANHPGEHTTLMNVVCPTHVLVTNNGKDHLEGFGSIAGVRKANKELFDCARPLKAKALVNKALPDLVEDSDGLDRILYPKDSVESMSGLQAGVSYDGTEIQSQLFGSFNEANILAAIAVGQQFEVPMSDIASAIAEYQPTLKRSQIIEKEGYTLVMDCYNANPTSMELSLKDFFDTTEAGTRVMVVGDMFEVGETEQQAHKETLELIEKNKDAHDYVMCVGPRFSLHQANVPFHFFPTPQEAKPFLESLSLNGKTVFLKASRGIRLEEILSQ